jgi:hypothetical protein
MYIYYNTILIMLRKCLILLNIIILLLSFCFLLIGGLFQCSNSYTGKLYGSLASAASMIFMIFIYLLRISAKNNGKFPLSEFHIFIPAIITILSILLTIYNIKKHKKDIMSNKSNTNYYFYNGLYVLSLGFIIIFQIFNLIMNHFYDFYKSNMFKYILLFFSITNALFSYLSHHYITPTEK